MPVPLDVGSILAWLQLRKTAMSHSPILHLRYLRSHVAGESDVCFFVPITLQQLSTEIFYDLPFRFHYCSFVCTPVVVSFFSRVL